MRESQWSYYEFEALSYLLFPRFEYITIVKEKRLHLVDTSRCDKDKVKDWT